MSSFFEDVLPGLSAAPNWHPLFVHYPVVLWTIALPVFAIGIARKRDDLVALGRWLAHAAAASALVTVVTGLIAEDALGHDSPGHDLVHAHKYFMLSTALIGVATSVVMHLTRSRTDLKSRALGGGMLLITVVVMSLGADRGALLVYGHGVGTRRQAGGDEHGKPAQQRESGQPEGVERPRETPPPEGGPHGQPPVEEAGPQRGEEQGEGGAGASHQH